jgi:hypothetical protein
MALVVLLSGSALCTEGDKKYLPGRPPSFLRVEYFLAVAFNVVMEIPQLSSGRCLFR